MLHALGNKSTLISRIMLLSLRRVSYSSAILLLSRYLTHSLYNTFSYPFINPDNHLHLYIYIYKIIRKTSLTSKKASDPSDKLFYREILLLLRNNAIFISFYRRIIIIIYIYIHTFFFFPILFWKSNGLCFLFSFSFSLFHANKCRLCVSLHHRLFTFTALDETLDAWNFSSSRFSEWIDSTSRRRSVHPDRRYRFSTRGWIFGISLPRPGGTKLSHSCVTRKLPTLAPISVSIFNFSFRSSAITKLRYTNLINFLGIF